MRARPGGRGSGGRSLLARSRREPSVVRDGTWPACGAASTRCSQRTARSHAWRGERPRSLTLAALSRRGWLEGPGLQRAEQRGVRVGGGRRARGLNTQVGAGRRIGVVLVGGNPGELAARPGVDCDGGAACGAPPLRAIAVTATSRQGVPRCGMCTFPLGSLWWLDAWWLDALAG